MASNWKSIFCNIARLIIQIVLFGFFLYLFGLPAWRRYQDKKVLVVTSMRDTGGLEAPAVTVVVERNETSTGWKADILRTSSFVERYCKDYIAKEQTISDCIEEKTYNLSEILESAHQGISFSPKPIDAVWKEEFTHNYPGRQYTLKIPGRLRIGTYQLYDIIRLKFQPNLAYRLFVHDPNYFYISKNPETAPPSVDKLVDPDKLPYYYRLGLTEVEELNVPNDPCNDDTDYNFNACVKETFLKTTGCKTKWDDVGLKNLPLCTEMSQFRSKFDSN